MLSTKAIDAMMNHNGERRSIMTNTENYSGGMTNEEAFDAMLGCSDENFPENRTLAEEARRDFENAKLHIAQGCEYSLNDYSTRLNNNVVVVGGSGTGKTRTIVTRNVLDAVGSYIIFDPKGTLYKKCGKHLKNKGHNIVLLDFANPGRGGHYNPLDVVRTPRDVMKISDILVDEAASVGTRADPFWDKITRTYINALMGYLLETDSLPRTIKSVLKLMHEGERGGEDDKDSPLNKRFGKLREENPESWAVSQFDNANTSPYKTYDTIRTTLAAKFCTLDSPELEEMMKRSDIDFRSIALEKTAVFATVSDTDRSMDMLVNLFITQAMQELCGFADNECEDGRLPVPVRFILDDFATNCRITDFPRIISTIRARSISTMIMLQSEAQLAQYYGIDYKTIISNCDTYVYLGGNDVETANSISRRCNKPMTQILNMPVGSCWVFRRGSAPVYTATNPPQEPER